MMTSTIRKFGVGVASLALVASAAAPAFADNRQEVPGPMDGMVNTDRFGGYDRIETAIKIAEAAFEKGNAVEVAYIAGATDASAVDSAAAGHLSDGPLYLVSGDGRSQGAVANSINTKYPNVQKIIAIGGSAVVSDATLKAVADATNAASTGRLAGKDRYGTAAAIAEHGANYVGLSEGSQWSTSIASKVYIARGDNPIDALVSGVLTDAPVLLLGPDGSVPEATAAYLKKHLPNHFVALGGEKAVPTSSFMKADFDPIMKNIWLNNEEVKAAREAVDYNEFLLEGIPGGESVNPKHDAAFMKNKLKAKYYGLTTADEAIKREELKTKQAELKTKQAELDKANKAKEDAGDTVKAAKEAAITVLEGTPSKDPFYEAFVKARKEYLGVDDYTFNTRDVTHSTGKYMGSYQAYKTAFYKLEDFKTAEGIAKEIDDAVDAFLAVHDDTKASADAKNDAAVALRGVVEKYISKFHDGATADVSTGTINNDTVAEKFVKTWFGGAANAKRSAIVTASAGLKGFADKDTDSASAVGATTSYAPTAKYSKDALRADRDEKIAKLNTTDENTVDGTRNLVFKFIGLKAASGLSEATLQSDLSKEKAFMDIDKAASSDEKKDAAIEHFLENSSEATAKEYRKVAGKYDDAIKAAQAEVDRVNREISVVKEALEMGSWNNGFKGYKRIEQKYSLLDGEHAFAMKNINAAINLRISQLKNSTAATVDVVGSDEKLQGWVKTGYGIDLKPSNVESYFAFKAPNVGEAPRVFRANFKRMEATSEANNLVDRAIELVNEFYAFTGDEGFDTGDMRAWFNPDNAGKNWRAHSPLYGKLTEEGQKKYDDAATAVWDALNSDTNRATWVWTDVVDPVLKTYRVKNSGGRNVAARVSNYLEAVALNNRKTAEANLAKAKLALQAALDKVLPKRYDRIEGKDRYETSAAIAGYWRAAYVYSEGLGYQMTKPLRIYVANGISYIDAVAGGQLKQGPIVLVAPDGKLTDAVKQRFAFAKTDSKILTITALGGSKVVSDQTLADAKAAARDKSLLGKNFFTAATDKAVDNAKDKKADEKKAEDKKADEKKADDKK